MTRRRNARIACALVTLACVEAVTAAASEKPVPSLGIDELHRRLVIEDRRVSQAFEREIERGGGVLVSGVFGDKQPLPTGGSHVWMRARRDAELIARFALPHSESKALDARALGSPLRLYCPAAFRSYALVIGDCVLRE